LDGDAPSAAKHSKNARSRVWDWLSLITRGVAGEIMALQQIECMECGKKFSRDVKEPKWQKIYAELGVVADQCDDCLQEYLLNQALGGDE
jgi:hypothetical protein